MHGLTLWLVQVDGSLLVLVLVDLTQMGAQLYNNNNDSFEQQFYQSRPRSLAAPR